MLDGENGKRDIGRKYLSMFSQWIHLSLFIVIIISWWTEIILLDASPFRIHFHLQLIISAKVNIKGNFCCYDLNILFNNIDKSYWCRTLGKNYTYNRLPNHFYYNARSITRELQKGFIYHNRKKDICWSQMFPAIKAYKMMIQPPSVRTKYIFLHIFSVVWELTVVMDGTS